MKPKAFASEIELCAAFLKSVNAGWIAYAETAGWDILLVRKADGFQIGIQAKLALNIDVINQAIEEYGHWSAVKEGPDCRAVLVPEGTGKLEPICNYLGLVVITQGSPSKWRYTTFHPELPAGPRASFQERWHEWAPMKRHKLPEYVPDVAAGSSAPIQLTEWKIKAIKLAIVLEKRGHVIRSDFHHLQIDHRRWIANGWLQLPPKTKEGQPGYIAGAMPPFKKQHPKVYEEIAAKFETWRPKAEALL